MQILIWGDEYETTNKYLYYFNYNGDYSWNVIYENR